MVDGLQDHFYWFWGAVNRGGVGGKRKRCMCLRGWDVCHRANTIPPLHPQTWSFCPCPHINNTLPSHCFSFTLVPGWASEGHMLRERERERERFSIKEVDRQQMLALFGFGSPEIFGIEAVMMWSHLVFHIRANRCKAVMRIGFYGRLRGRDFKVVWNLRNVGPTVSCAEVWDFKKVH